jgi:hypothetical protein
MTRNLESGVPALAVRMPRSLRDTLDRWPGRVLWLLLLWHK